MIILDFKIVIIKLVINVLTNFSMFRI